MTTEKNKIIFIVAQEGFRDEELFDTKEVLESKGFEIIIASEKKGLCVGKLGGQIESDKEIENINLEEDVVAVVVIGGPGSPSLMKIPSLGELLREVRKKNLILGAICYAPAIVASFGVIDGASATCYADDFSMPILKEHSILFIDELVVVDDKLITGNGPSSAKAFGEEIANSLLEEN